MTTGDGAVAEGISMKNEIITGHRYISEDYQRVIEAAAHGQFSNSPHHWIEDTSGIIYKAADWRPFK